MITNIDFVGFEDELQNIRESLFDAQEKDLGVVSLVGMPGNGKTTLAQKIYQDPTVRHHFDIRACCTVTQLYRKREMWKTILCEISGSAKDGEMVGHHDDEEQIRQKIYQNLKQRRYLIIIDDMWDIETWNDLKRYLPNDKKGSRVLITTRQQDVAKQASSIPSNVHSLRLFTESESYELLERKSGLKDYHSEELIQVGHQIALKCGGLPLAISIIAGHLAKSEKNVWEWKEILADLSFRLLNDKDTPYRVILEWSFNCLPEYLQQCFRYAGVLARAYKRVYVWKLKLLWIAEGFVCDNKLESPDKHAEDYLVDLINRNLIIPVCERSIGGVKEIRMHDLLADFCLKLSEEDSFMVEIKSGSRHEPCESEEVRIWLREHEKPSGSSLGSGHCVRSILMPLYRSVGDGDLHAAINSMDFKRLQVLDVCRDRTWRITTTIFDLDHWFVDTIFSFPIPPHQHSLLSSIYDSVIWTACPSHLKYFTAGASSEIPNLCIPYFILFDSENFGNLRTVIIDNGDCELNIPDSIWDMINLRNVHLSNCGEPVRFQVESSRLEKFSFPGNLETLSTPFFNSASDAEMLRGMPMLRKLSCAYGDCLDHPVGITPLKRNGSRFPNLEFLTQLMSLKIAWMFGGEPILGRLKFNFPSNLKKLTLFSCRIPWNKLSNIGREVPNLEVLKIGLTGEGGKWTVMEGDFPNLRYLKIRMNYQITEWLAHEESFPKLEQLHLEKLYALEEIPSSFEDVGCLRLISVYYCKGSLGNSAIRIGRVQKEETQNEDFVVDVRSPIFEAKTTCAQNVWKFVRMYSLMI